ncbi:glycosyltransferase family 1 protein [Emcibacter sp. SYSU 3D8]|uniref:glycosyltransferase family 4 protein n=1 Tax=Emcibacter sp. SYSU 3D8 TaxID=3133969 RepID=UPI0031FE8472
MPDQSIRLALFSGNYNYVTDGAAVALNHLVAHLERRGIESLVFSPTADHPAFEPAGTLVSVPSIAIPGRSEYRVALGLPREQRRRLREFRPTLFHLSAPDLLGYAARGLARQWGIPLVASFHTRYDTYFRYYRMAWLESTATRYLRHFYRPCEQIYVPSESTAQVLREQHMSRDVRIWSRGVDDGRFNPDKRDLQWRRALGFGDDETVIAFVGRLVLEKGIDCFARTIAGLRERGVVHRVLVVGDGPERTRFKEMLPDDAVFTGYLDGDDLARAYASSELFLNPSVTETFGIVTLESMAVGLPSVCADATGSQSLVADGESGFLVRPDDERGFVDAVARLVADPALRARMGSAARERSRDYTWDAVIETLVQHYCEVLERHRAGAADGASGAARRRVLVDDAALT